MEKLFRERKGGGSVKRRGCRERTLPPSGQQTGGTHPTGMLSCSKEIKERNEKQTQAKQPQAAVCSEKMGRGWKTAVRHPRAFHKFTWKDCIQIVFFSIQLTVFSTFSQKPKISVELILVTEGRSVGFLFLFHQFSWKVRRKSWLHLEFQLQNYA